MYRTHHCGQLRITDIGSLVVLSGWVSKYRDFGAMCFIDLRDRYGITQISFNENSNKELLEKSRLLGREFVIQIKGVVIERENKNKKIATGDIEIDAKELIILNTSKTPPFTIENDTDGGDELRMKYRYLDLRRECVRNNMILRSQLAQIVRSYLSKIDFIEVETPVLIKSTPEGARDFLVPSRMNTGTFYALPQSPQTFKQLLMVSGFDKYFQIVKCFRDEDLRADRQPEFTQIDCEMSFVEQEDIIQVFEGLTKHIFKQLKNIDFDNFERITYSDAMKFYGNDKPDLRFDMKFVDMNEVVKGNNFSLFDQSELVIGIVAKGVNNTFTRKQIDDLTDFVKRPQIGAKGLIYCRINDDGTLKSSVDKFFNENQLNQWKQITNAEKGDIIFVLCGQTSEVRKQMSELRLELGERLALRNKNLYKPLWVIDFPLLEYNEEEKRYFAMHHPFTSPLKSDIELLDSNPEKVKANAYDLVINGVEIGGGSIRIFDKKLQQKMFDTLGFTNEEAQNQFGFLLDAFEYGAPPHGGIAFGFDRLCAVLGGSDSIRDYIAFPKNNQGKDVMIDAPSIIDEKQLNELHIKTF